ncbi:glucose-6-phosphate isomerase [Thiomicrospira cyclica]|uniref:Glucose-6-phosphate isomerase n=1 Tax=Thiomicrospira cyclica (strain DSM 14477 / JCM 11371 / ALM1) TaxID=717773 RepID=F6D9W2_THICA|nr:glucose-6-phosphate isomerase [Thiomicrospira cyclica]AEG30999.1 Glucose-6-phosphate isomerase [Thiomicrospira cyclica ALM1]
MVVNQSSAWQALMALAESGVATKHLQDWFQAQPDRAERYSIELDELYLDYSKNRIDDQVLDGLLALAEQQGMAQWIERLVTGDIVNDTEARPALHSALRGLQGAPASGLAAKVQPEIESQFNKMAKIVNKIRAGHWRGYSGKPITDVVNIGVGGSDLGPLMVTHALQVQQSPVRLHFVSSIDGTQTSNLLNTLNQETTLFVLASKSFTTIDTLSNAETAKDWLEERIERSGTLMAQHFIGVSTRPDKMLEWGIPEENQLLFWEWVGGRYSMWSAIGFPIALKVGMKGFYQMLEGANLMDEHFATAPLAENIPVIMGLVDVWNINFLNINAKAILPYDARLKYLPSYFEQLVMESNGKSVNRNGDKVPYKTCPILWGEVGPNAQHAFYQLLHQGTQAVMSDFIVPVERDDFERYSGADKDASLLKQHHLALANCFAQSRVLMLGDAAIPDSLKASFNSPYKHYEGNQPSNTILLKTLSAKTLGMLVALYEHKTFVESVVWEINPFDQWGVELGKLIAKETYACLAEDAPLASFDASTQALMKRVK